MACQKIRPWTPFCAIYAWLSGRCPGGWALVKKAALQAAVGIPLGWAIAYAGRQELVNVLYGVKAGNPWVLGSASGLVALAALLAALRPAFIAARVDPIVALRCE